MTRPMLELRIALCVVLCAAAASAQGMPRRRPPKTTSHLFTPGSFWNRPALADAEFADIQDVLLGNPAQAPTRLFMELITLLRVDPAAPVVNVKLSAGFSWPQRSQPVGSTLAQFHLDADAGVHQGTHNGNGHFGILDQATGQLFQGVGLWRDSGSSTLLTSNYEPTFTLNALADDGSLGFRAAGFSGLGGMLMPGEINHGIRHPLALLVNARQLSSGQHWTWPAHTADSYANDPFTGYHGSNPNYMMGTLLRIPPGVDLGSLNWQSPQGRVLADCAQRYGYYVADDVAGSDLIGLSMEHTAMSDIGLVVDPETGYESVDPAKLNYPAFWHDFYQILGLLKAVTNNHP